MTRSLLLALSLIPAVLLAQASPLPPALAAMVETERAFARAVAEKGVRNGFLEYFADDSVGFAAEPRPAKDALRKGRNTPPSILELTWEPRYGDAAASGELGYLTGPATRSLHGDKPEPPLHMAYFSIWKKQADGSYKVFIDQGINTPGPVPFAPGFTPARRARGAAGRATETSTGGATASVMETDRGLMVAARSKTPAEVYGQFMSNDGRLYRDGLMPMVGKTAAVAWLGRQQARKMTSEPLHAEAARSGDLALSYGRYVLEGAPQEEHGHYVRVWTRDAAGAWRIALDVTVPKT